MAAARLRDHGARCAHAVVKMYGVFCVEIVCVGASRLMTPALVKMPSRDRTAHVEHRVIDDRQAVEGCERRARSVCVTTVVGHRG